MNQNSPGFWVNGKHFFTVCSICLHSFTLLGNLKWSKLNIFQYETIFSTIYKCKNFKNDTPPCVLASHGQKTRKQEAYIKLSSFYFYYQTALTLFLLSGNVYTNYPPPHTLSKASSPFLWIEQENIQAIETKASYIFLQRFRVRDIFLWGRGVAIVSIYFSQKSKEVQIRPT